MNINEIIDFYKYEISNIVADKINKPSLVFYNNIDHKSEFYAKIVSIHRLLKTLIAVLYNIWIIPSGRDIHETLSKAKDQLIDAKEALRESKGRNRSNYRDAKRDETQAKHLLLILPLQLAFRKYCATGIFKEPKAGL